jgi:hypothetical protein
VSAAVVSGTKRGPMPRLDDGKEFDRLVCCDEGDAMFVPRHMLEGSAGTRSIPLHTDLLLKSISLSRPKLGPAVLWAGLNPL